MISRIIKFLNVLYDYYKIIIINIARYYAKQEGNEKKRPMSSYVGCKKDNSYLLNKHKYLS